MILTLQEQKATLQCIWQVLAAKPTLEESELLQNQLLRGWESIECVDMSDKAFYMALLGCEIKSWIVIAVEDDPYESFALVSRMPAEKKDFVKKVILQLIDSYASHPMYARRAPYAQTLFEKCDIPFRLKGWIWADGFVGVKIV